MQNKKLIHKLLLILLLCLFLYTLKADDYEGLFNNSVQQLFRSVPQSAMIGIIYISENDINTALNIQDDLIHTITELGYCCISKDWMEYIPYFEENYGIRFKFNTAINEESVLEIGSFIRADVVLTGRVIEGDNSRKLNLRAIDMKSEQVIGSVTCDL